MLTIDVHIPDITGFKVIARYETQAAVLIITASPITKAQYNELYNMFLEIAKNQKEYYQVRDYDCFKLPLFVIREEIDSYKLLFA